MDSSFPNDQSRTDNFKVRPEATPVRLQVLKFYDTNANGANDDGQLIAGWEVRIYDDIDWIRYTPVDVEVAPDTYTVMELPSLEPNWIATTPQSVAPVTPPAVVEFGNLCLGAGGGLILAGSSYRAYQEALKNALDRANNKYTFVRPTPYPFTFADS